MHFQDSDCRDRDTKWPFSVAKLCLLDGTSDQTIHILFSQKKRDSSIYSSIGAVLTNYMSSHS
jgi:hypothetical protein